MKKKVNEKNCPNFFSEHKKMSQILYLLTIQNKNGQISKWPKKLLTNSNEWTKTRKNFKISKFQKIKISEKLNTYVKIKKEKKN